MKTEDTDKNNRNDALSFSDIYVFMKSLDFSMFSCVLSCWMILSNVGNQLALVDPQKKDSCTGFKRCEKEIKVDRICISWGVNCLFKTNSCDIMTNFVLNEECIKLNEFKLS